MIANYDVKTNSASNISNNTINNDDNHRVTTLCMYLLVNVYS